MSNLLELQISDFRIGIKILFSVFLLLHNVISLFRYFVISSNWGTNNEAMYNFTILFKLIERLRGFVFVSVWFS